MQYLYLYLLVVREADVEKEVMGSILDRDVPKVLKIIPPGKISARRIRSFS